MIFSWLRKRRRRAAERRPFPEAWLEHIKRNVWLYSRLRPEEQERLRRDVQVFVADKNWEGCGGLEITEEMQATIAAEACVLVLGREQDYYSRVLSILVYPSGFRALRQQAADLEPVFDEALTGQAWYRGPVLLAWDEVLEGSRHPQNGRNLVYHEFAHQLDMLDGGIDGTPPLDDNEQYHNWREVMTHEYLRLVRAAAQDRDTLLDPYGAENEAEFFAVATECFFTQPAQLQARHPRLYGILQSFYRQDPAARLRR